MKKFQNFKTNCFYKTICYLLFCFIFIIFILSIKAFGETYISSEHSFWKSYKETFIKDLSKDKGAIVVDNHFNFAPSEGMGHALIFAAQNWDWKTFNYLLKGLENFKKSNGLFRWKINSDASFPSSDDNLSSASETEQNVAYALLLAYEATGKKIYKDQALELLSKIWEGETISLQGKRVVLPADFTDNNPKWPVEYYGDRSIKIAAWNPSYFSPRMYRKFADYDLVHDWNKVVADGYALLNSTLDRVMEEPKRFGIYGMNPVPAWVWLVPIGGAQIKIDTYFPNFYQPDPYVSNEWDTIRIPIYIGMDASSFEAQKFLEKFFKYAKVEKPQDALIGKLPGYNNEMAIGAYSVGLKAIGRDVSSFKEKIKIEDDGFFVGPRIYYHQTICNYAYIILNGEF